jgi:hypothetical protein
MLEELAMVGRDVEDRIGRAEVRVVGTGRRKEDFEATASRR